MQVFHTAGVPPSSGNNNFPNMGCTEKSNKALRNNVVPKLAVTSSVLFLLVMLVLI